MKVLWIIPFVALFSCMWSVFIYFLVLWVNVPCFYNPMTQNYGWVHDSCMTVHFCYIIYLTSHKNCCKKLSIACHKFAHFFIIQMVWCLSFIFIKIWKLTLQKPIKRTKYSTYHFYKILTDVYANLSIKPWKNYGSEIINIRSWERWSIWMSKQTQNRYFVVLQNIT